MKQTRKDDINIKAPPSIYAQFYFKYIGYSFKKLGTNKVYSKGEFWDCFNNLARQLISADGLIAPPGFELIKNNK